MPTPRPLFPPGLWSVTVSGRKHSIRLCSPRQSEAERWGVAAGGDCLQGASGDPAAAAPRTFQVRERELHGEREGDGPLSSRLKGELPSPTLHLVPWPLGESWGPRSRDAYLQKKPDSEAHQWSPVPPAPASIRSHCPRWWCHGPSHWMGSHLIGSRSPQRTSP